MRHPWLAAALPLSLALALVPAVAQNAPASPASPAVDAPAPGPTTEQLNAAVNGNIAESQAASDVDEAIYAAGVAEDASRYDQALQARQDQLFRQDARYRKQLRAYEDAMAAWRTQVSECKKGKQAACDAPTPNPADFY